MKLEGYYYDLIEERADAQGGTFRIALRQDCDIYAGHFPGRPVCPGVCHIQVVKECAERLTGKKLRIGHIRQCRLTAVAVPSACSELAVSIQLQPAEEGYRIAATVADTERTYMEYKGEMSV